MDSTLGNLIFVVVAVLAWIVKEAVERKEAKEAAQKRRERAGQPAPAEQGTGEVDIVYGRRKIPDALTAPPVPSTGQPQLGATARPAAEAVAHTGGRLVSFSGHRLKTELQTTTGTATPAPGGDEDSAMGWARLGLAEGGDRRAAVRAGILWSEVLATPRAIMGPHRSPAARRMQGRRGSRKLL